MFQGGGPSWTILGAALVALPLSWLISLSGVPVNAAAFVTTTFGRMVWQSIGPATLLAHAFAFFIVGLLLFAFPPFRLPLWVLSMGYWAWSGLAAAGLIAPPH